MVHLAEFARRVLAAEVETRLKAETPHWLLERDSLERRYHTASWKRTVMVINTALAGVKQVFCDDPLLHPLGRASDSAIDEALMARGLERADLFTPGTTLAPHRHRLAAMLAIQGLSPRDVVADHWPALKTADHRCAYCANSKRCESWLKWGCPNDAPRMFCPSAAAFEQIKASTVH
ncbi:MAG: hypothetical protein ACFCUQ_04910 [Kiloniellales bacterium]